MCGAWPDSKYHLCGVIDIKPYNSSNGIVNVGFVMYQSMKNVATETILFVRSRRRKGKKTKAAKRHEESNGKADKGRENGHSSGEGAEEDPIAVLWRICSGTLIPGMINVVLAVTPFAAFQGISCQQDLTSERRVLVEVGFFPHQVVDLRLTAPSNRLISR